MMFTDYYSLLEISEAASKEEIKKAFRTQAVKWHPDRNQNVNTTSRMQDINEAYLILYDIEARARYDLVYLRFKTYKPRMTREAFESHESCSSSSQQSNKSKGEQGDFEIEDDVLENWINNAKRQAVDLAQLTIRDLKGISKAAFQKFLESAKQLVVWIVVINVLVLIFKACNDS